MSDRIEFPNEPIRVGPSIEELIARERETDPFEHEYDDRDPEERNCQSCGGDGFAECDGTDLMCPEADDSGCYMSHVYLCTNCGGSGDAKDQRFW